MLETLRRIDTKPGKHVVSKITVGETFTPIAPYTKRSGATSLDRVNVTVAGRERTFVYKKYPASMQIDHIFEAYRKAKQVGIPVPHTFRATEDNQGILMTDLTEGGKNIVISANEIFIEADHPKQIEQMLTNGLHPLAKLYREKPEMMHYFGNAESLRTSVPLNQQFDKWAEVAAGMELAIGSVGWFLSIKPDKTFSSILGDFEEIDVTPDFSRTDLITYNRTNLIDFCNYMDLAQTYAKEPEEGKKKLIKFAYDTF